MNALGCHCVQKVEHYRHTDEQTDVTKKFYHATFAENITGQY